MEVNVIQFSKKDTIEADNKAITILNAEHADLLKLSPSERLLLAQDLWDSLNPEDVPLTDWQKPSLTAEKRLIKPIRLSHSSWEDVQGRIVERHG